MKVLTLNLYFRLPDDFVGDLNEAMEALVAYRRSKGYVGAPALQGEQIGPPIVGDVGIWERFLTSVQEGYALTGGASISDVAVP